MPEVLGVGSAAQPVRIKASRMGINFLKNSLSVVFGWKIGTVSCQNGGCGAKSPHSNRKWGDVVLLLSGNGLRHRIGSLSTFLHDFLQIEGCNVGSFGKNGVKIVDSVHFA